MTNVTIVMQTYIPYTDLSGEHFPLHCEMLCSVDSGIPLTRASDKVELDFGLDGMITGVVAEEPTHVYRYNTETKSFDISIVVEVLFTEHYNFGDESNKYIDDVLEDTKYPWQMV